MNIPHMVTINEAARLCQEGNVGISKNFIRALVKQDAIPYIKCGVKVLLITSVAMMDIKMAAKWSGP